MSTEPQPASSVNFLLREGTAEVVVQVRDQNGRNIGPRPFTAANALNMFTALCAPLFQARNAAEVPIIEVGNVLLRFAGSRLTIAQRFPEETRSTTFIAPGGGSRVQRVRIPARWWYADLSMLIQGALSNPRIVVEIPVREDQQVGEGRSRAVAGWVWGNGYADGHICWGGNAPAVQSLKEVDDYFLGAPFNSDVTADRTLCSSIWSTRNLVGSMRPVSAFQRLNYYIVNNNGTATQATYPSIHVPPPYTEDASAAAAAVTGG